MNYKIESFFINEQEEQEKSTSEIFDELYSEYLENPSSEKAIEDLINHFMPSVKKFARVLFDTDDSEYEDAIQNSIKELLRGLQISLDKDQEEVSRSVLLQRAKEGIRRSYENKTYKMKIKTHDFQSAADNISKYYRDFLKNYGRRPSIGEISAHFNLPEDQAAYLLKSIGKSYISTDKKDIGEFENEIFISKASDTNQKAYKTSKAIGQYDPDEVDSAEDLVDKKIVIDKIMSFINNEMDEKNALVLKKHLEGMSDLDIAEDLGLTRQAIYLRRMNAIKSIRNKFKNVKLNI